MARPQISKTVKHVEETIAIEMAVDISGSMKALDMVNPETGETNSVSRLEMVKKVFSRFVKEGPDNLVGLITFGGYAVTRSPLTTDHNTLITILKEVEVPEDSSSAGGSLLKEETLTAIGDALALSCARLKDTSAKNKVVILLSDGVSNCGAVTPEQAVLTAREMNIRVYTIGVGSTGKAPFREKDMFGRWILKYEDVEMDEELLKNIASLTGGKYYNVMDWNELSSAMNEINALEKSPAVVLTREEHKDLSTLFLLPAAVLLITGVMLGIILSGKPI